MPFTAIFIALKMTISTWKIAIIKNVGFEGVYLNYPKFSDKQALANSADPDPT